MKVGSLAKVQGNSTPKDNNEYKSKKDIDKLTSYVANSAGKAYTNARILGTLGAIAGIPSGHMNAGRTIGQTLGIAKGIYKGVKEVDKGADSVYADIDSNNNASHFTKGLYKLGRSASGLVGSVLGSNLAGNAVGMLGTAVGLPPIGATLAGISGRLLGYKYGDKLGNYVGSKVFRFRPKKQTEQDDVNNKKH